MDIKNNLPIPKPAASIAEVLERMRAINAVLPPADGIACFNWLYYKTTEAMAHAVDAGRFEDRHFLTRLDVLFANRYFAALSAYAQNPQHAPRAWQALFDARAQGQVAPLHFALAGMNAHINFDLSQSVVATCAELGLQLAIGSRQHRDYLAVNDVLASLEPQLRPWLAPRWASIGGMPVERAEDVAALWSIRRARDVAWDCAEVLWALAPDPRLHGNLVTCLDRLVGLTGRGLLLPPRLLPTV